MSNYDKYANAFIECFSVPKEKVPGLKYQDIPEWDSVGHMDLIATIEDAFDIMMEMDDVVDFSSFEKGIELLKKYGIEI